MPNYIISLDIGATKIAAALIADNKVVKKFRKPTGASGTKIQIVANISSVIKQLWLGNIKKITIGFAGQIDPKKGVIISTANFNPAFKQIPLAEILSKEFKVPVTIDNDAKCFALGELNFGEGKHFKNFIALTFGTGIGGGIIIDKKLVRGQDNLAGEFSHMKISGSWSGAIPVCGCGQKYCWETIASGRAWMKLQKKHGAKNANKIIAQNVAIGLANLSAIFNPEAFILAGSLMKNPGILGAIRKEYNQKVFNPALRKTKLINSKLRSDAVLLGATI